MTLFENNAKAEGGASLSQIGQRVDSEEHQWHLDQEIDPSAATYDAAHKAAENPAPKISPPVGFGHPSNPALQDQMDQHVHGLNSRFTISDNLTPEMNRSIETGLSSDENQRAETSSLRVKKNTTDTSRNDNKDSQPTSMITTLQPYENSKNHRPSTSNLRGRGGRLNNRNSNRTVEYPDLRPTLTSFKKFFVIKDSNDEELWPNIDTWKANRELIKILKGEPKNLTEQRSGSILIEVANMEQSARIRQLKVLNNKQVKVEEHHFLNFTRGTIHCKRFINKEDDELLQELANQNVTKIYKVKRKINNSLELTGTMVLTFDSCTLPEKVKLGWTAFEVRPYVPSVRQCFKCLKFNHSSRVCRATTDRCSNCGEEGHTYLVCSNPINCANCDQAHKAVDQKCPVYQIEKETIAYQTKEKSSYGDAKKHAIKLLGAKGISYADILKSRKTARSTPEERPHSQTLPQRNPQNNQLPYEKPRPQKSVTLSPREQDVIDQPKKRTQELIKAEREKQKELLTKVEEKQKIQVQKSQSNNKRPISSDEETQENSKLLKISNSADEESTSNRTSETTRTSSSSHASEKLLDDSSQGAISVPTEKIAPQIEPNAMDTGGGFWDFTKPQPPKPPPLPKHNSQEPNNQNTHQQIPSLISNVAKQFSNRSRSSSREERGRRM